jgi:hypothetical protein
MQDDRQFVDELLEAGLARYSDVTPRPGFEKRLLVAAAERERGSWFVWAGWLAAGAVAATVVLGVIVLRHAHTMPTPRPAAATLAKSGGSGGSQAEPAGIRRGTIAPARTVTRRSLLARRAVHHAVTATVDEPRLAVFPSPQPVTEEEKLLLQYVHHTPPQALAAVATSDEDMQNDDIKLIDAAPHPAEETGTKAR